MSLSVACPGCEAQFRVQLQHAGRMAKCPRCQHAFRVPAAVSATDVLAASKTGVAAATTPAAPKKKPSAPRPAVAKAQDSGSLSKQIMAGFAGQMKRPRTSLAYQLAAVVVAMLMVLLPVVYMGLIALAGYGVYYHAVNHIGIIGAGGRFNPRLVIVEILLYAAPIVAGVIAVLFMFKPLLAPPARAERRRTLRRESEPLLFAFVDRVCDTVGAPRPRRIDVDCMVNASAGFRRGLLSMLGRDLVLTIGMPLAAGLNTRQFAGVLAHEFGHFRQGIGMRLNYIIRRINAWFMRVVYQRDQWDVWLEETAESLDARVSWIFLLAMLCVKLSRGVLWLLLLVGDFFGCRLLRQQEFDADRHEVRMSGSDAFEQTHRRILILNVAMEASYKDLQQLSHEGRLVDDLPKLMLVNAAQMPAELQRAIDRRIEEGKARWFDTHPSDASRIAAARRVGGDGVYRVELPAAALFADFTAQCKEATWDSYRGLFGNRISREALRPVSDVEARHDAARDGRKALDRFFSGEWHAAAPLPLGNVRLEPPTNPQATLAELKRVRQQITAMLPQSRGARERIAAAQSRAIEAETLSFLQRAGGKIPKEALARWGGVEGIKRAVKSTAAEFEAATSSFAAYDELLARRLRLALQLAQLPKVAARIGEQFNVRTLDRLFDALSTLCDQLKTLSTVYGRHASLGMLLEALQTGAADRDALESIVRDHMKWLVGPAKQLHTAFSRTAYPFPHARGTIMLSQHLMSEPPIAGDLRSIYVSLAQAIEMAPPLYARILAEIVSAVEAVEGACGIAATPAQPATPES